MKYKVGIDIGGTFTDLVVCDSEGSIELGKVPSRPEDPGSALLEGLELCADQLNIDFNEFVSNIGILVHGTTVGTNAVLSKVGPKTGLICTKNFRDVLLLRDGYKPNRWNLKMDPPEPFVPRYLTFPVEERINSEGEIIKSLNEDDVIKAGNFFRKNEVKTVGCCLIWSIANPEHERKIAEIFKKKFKDIIISISTDIQPIMREWQRSCTIVCNAFLIPIMSEYLNNISQMLSKIGFRGHLLIVQSNSGITSVEQLKLKPVNLLMSGPSVGPNAGLYYLKQLNTKDGIVIDMGGTSFDISVVTDGTIRTIKQLNIGEMPILVQAVDVKSIGAGGGSIAWVDKGGALHVGPKSAGSEPGPACYMKGGIEPTVTDANVLLGYINPDFFLGGRMKIDSSLSYKAVKDKIADTLKITVKEAALGIYKVVNNNMVGAIRAILAERGIDPQDYNMIVGGGAGAIHASVIAKEIGISRLIIPRSASQLCAFGLVTTDIRHDYVRNYTCTSTNAKAEDLNKIYEEMEKEAKKDMEDIRGRNTNIRFIRSADIKYPYQVYELNVEITLGIIKQEDIQKITNNFHDLHEKIYTYAIRDSLCQFVALRLLAISEVEKVKALEHKISKESPEIAKKGYRKLIMDDSESLCSVPIYNGDLLKAGMKIEGPAVVEEVATTILLIPNSILYVNKWSDYEIKIVN